MFLSNNLSVLLFATRVKGGSSTPAGFRFPSDQEAHATLESTFDLGIKYVLLRCGTCAWMLMWMWMWMQMYM